MLAVPGCGRARRGCRPHAPDAQPAPRLVSSPAAHGYARAFEIPYVSRDEPRLLSGAGEQRLRRGGEGHQHRPARPRAWGACRRQGELCRAHQAVPVSRCFQTGVSQPPVGSERVRFRGTSSGIPRTPVTRTKPRPRPSTLTRGKGGARAPGPKDPKGLPTHSDGIVGIASASARGGELVGSEQTVSYVHDAGAGGTTVRPAPSPSAKRTAKPARSSVADVDHLDSGRHAQ